MPNRYWVAGGSGLWNGTDTNNWSATSGGASGASVPTTADDVFFDASSGAGTATISTGNTGAASIDCTGFTGTIAQSANITVAGSLTFVAGMTFSRPVASTITFTGTGTFTTGGKSFNNGFIVINGSGITVTLGDAYSGGTMTLQQGTLTTNDYNITCPEFGVSGTGTKVINAGASTISVSSSGGAIGFGSTLNTSLTFNAGTSQINLTETSGGTFLQGGGQTFYNVTFTGTGANTRNVNAPNTFNNLTITAPSSSGMAQVSFNSSQTINGTLTCAGASSVRRCFLRSDTIGTTRTITAAVISADDCDFRDITIAGAASPISPTRAGDCGGNTNITFPAAKTVYRVGTNTSWVGSNSWATTSGGTGNNDNFPLAQDTAVIDENTTLTGTLSIAGGTVFNLGSLDSSTRTTGITLTFTSGTLWYGSHTFGSGVTISGTSAQTFSGRGTMTFTSAGKTITFPITVDAPGGTFQLGDAFSGSQAITHTRGTFDANDYNLTCTTFSSSNTNTRTITMGSGLWTLSGTGTGTSSVWNLGTNISNLTFNKDTADILFSNTSTTAREFRGSSLGLSYNKLTIGGATGTSVTTINGPNTFSEIASTKTVAHTISFSDNQTIATWSVTGTSGNVVTLQSSSAGTTRTLTKSGGGFLTGIDYLDVRDVVGSPVSDTWYIGSNSVYNTTAPNTARGFFLTQRADNAVIVLEDTSGSGTWTVPSDWNNSNNTIHLIGGGGGGASGRASTNNRAAGGGGGGGGYTQLTNQTLTIGASITYQAGSGGTGGASGGGGNNGGAGGTTSWNAGASTAGGGGGGACVANPPSSTGGTAGTGSTYNGGVGGAGAVGTVAATGYGGGGGAGAAGPNGAGGNGGDGFGSTTAGDIAGGGGGGNGGGSNGGNASAATGGTGGNNSLGSGGGASNTGGTNGGGGGGSVSAASLGGYGVEVFGTGSGGGGGGSDDAVRTNTGGLYGAGGGGGGVQTGSSTTAGSAGAQGAIIITYVPGGAVTPTGNMFFMFN